MNWITLTTDFTERDDYVGVMKGAIAGIAARLGDCYFVGPDNGLITFLYNQAQERKAEIAIHALENPDYRLAQVSHTFHGRDVFAPAAAHLSLDAPLESFGRVVADPILLPLASPLRTANGWQGEIIYVDAFGNLAANIREENLANFKNIHIILKNTKIEGITETFG
jgi:S-adenosylmethionine hydrolase